jgi:hypothetical protein
MEPQERVRKSKEAPPATEPEEEPEQIQEEEHVEVEVEEKPKKAPAKKATPKKEKPVVPKEVYDVETAPDVVIHKRHKGAKPRKIVVITGDSSANESDEELPYRAKPKVEIKKRTPAPAAPKKEAPLPKPSPAKRQQNVGLVGEKPKPVDTGKGVSQRYATPAPEKKGYVVDEYIDALLNL